MRFVFVSYASEDASLAQTIVDRLKSALEPSGVRIRYDEDKTAARLFPEWVDENIVAADRVLVLWSASAAQSSFVRAEAEKARSLGKYVACLIDPEFNPETDLAPPFNVYLTPLVVMPDLAAEASTLSLDDDEFNKLAEELGKPPTVPSAETVDVGAATNPQEAADREKKVANVDPWSFPGSVEPDVAEERLRTLYVGGLARLLAHEDAEVREAAAKYLEGEISTQDNALSALVSAATRINSQALWNDVGALHLPRRPSDAIVAWRRASFTDAEICRRLGLPLSTLGAAAVGAQAARIINEEEAAKAAEAESAAAEAAAIEAAQASSEDEPSEAGPEAVTEAADEAGETIDEADGDEEPEEETVEEKAAQQEPVAAEPASVAAAPVTAPSAAQAAPPAEAVEEAEGDDDDDDGDDDGDEREDHYRVPERRKGGAGAFFAGAFTLFLLLGAGGAAALYFLKIGEEPAYKRLLAALDLAPGAETTAAPGQAAPTAAASAPLRTSEAGECVDAARFNGLSLEAQRTVLSTCGLMLAAAPAPVVAAPTIPTPAWCRNADVFAALADATGDITEELEACGVELPTPAPTLAPEPVIERVVETVVEPCPKPEEFNGLDFEAQGPLLAACGLTLAEPEPVQVAAAQPEPTERVAERAAAAVEPPPPGDGAQACSPSVGPPCRVTLSTPTALSRIAETFYGRPVAWCWIYDRNREVFQSESRPPLVRDDPNCVYTGDSYMLETLPADWTYGENCEHKDMLSDMCPRSLSETLGGDAR